MNGPRLRRALFRAAARRAARRRRAAAGPTSATASKVVRAVRRVLPEYGEAGFCEAVWKELEVHGFTVTCEQCGAAACRCSAAKLDDLVAVLGPLGVRGAVRSAVELYGTYGDPDDLLSTTQVDQLCAAAANFDSE